MHRPMHRIVRLIKATDQETSDRTYQRGLQTMWEARWVRLGLAGKADWIRCHGAPPPSLCPLTHAAPLHGVRIQLRGGVSMPLLRIVRRIRRNL